MPFTPFHFGPGLLIKGMAPRRFSWVTFVITQVFIDCETLYYLIQREAPVHRALHTLLGATAVGLLTAGFLLGLKRIASRIFPKTESWPPSLASEVSNIGVLVGGIIGGSSHSLLDSLMHFDLRPFSPFSEANPLLNSIGIFGLHGGCMLSALLGVCVIWFNVKRELANIRLSQA